MQELLAAAAMTVCLVFGVILRYVPFKSIIDEKRKKFLFAAYGIGFLLNIVLLTIRFNSIGVSVKMVRIDGVIFAAVMALVNVAIIGKKIREQLFTFGMIIVCNYTLVSVPEYISAYLPEMPDKKEFYLYMIIYFLALVLTFIPMKKLVKITVEPFLSIESDNYWNTLWFIPIALFLPLFFAIPIDSATAGDVVRLVSRLLIVLVNIFLCLSMAKDHKVFLEKQKISDQLIDQSVYYTELQTRVADARKTKHDMKHFISAVYQFIDHDDKEGLRAFCDDLSDRNDMDRKTMPYTGNVAVDGIVYKYMQLCENGNIEFSYSGTIRSGKIADIDICVLIGNALDNAYTACKDLDDNRKISLLSRSENQLLTIIVQNTFDGRVDETDDGQLISRKRGDRTGVGMLSMKSVCDRYDGTIEKYWDGNTFTVMFMLPIKE